MKYYQKFMLLFCFVLLIFLFWGLFQSGLLDVFWNYAFDSGYREVFNYDLHHLSPGASLLEVMKTLIDEYTWETDLFLQKCSIPFSIIMPLVVSLAGIEFMNKKNSIAGYAVYRTSGRSVYYFREAVLISAGYALAFALAAFAFFVIINSLSHGTFYGDVGCQMFLDLLSRQFYYSHPYMYWGLNYFFRFFILPFLYAFFSCSIAMSVSTYRNTFMISNLIHFTLTIGGNGLVPYLGSLTLYFTPYLLLTDGGAFAFNDYKTIPVLTVQVVLPLLISCMIIRKQCAYAEI